MACHVSVQQFNCIFFKYNRLCNIVENCIICMPFSHPTIRLTCRRFLPCHAGSDARPVDVSRVPSVDPSLDAFLPNHRHDYQFFDESSTAGVKSLCYSARVLGTLMALGFLMTLVVELLPTDVCADGEHRGSRADTCDIERRSHERYKKSANFNHRTIIRRKVLASNLFCTATIKIKMNPAQRITVISNYICDDNSKTGLHCLHDNYFTFYQPLRENNPNVVF